jgi:hypothetical protein
MACPLDFLPSLKMIHACCSADLQPHLFVANGPICDQQVFGHRDEAYTSMLTTVCRHIYALLHGIANYLRGLMLWKSTRASHTMLRPAYKPNPKISQQT